MTPSAMKDTMTSPSLLSRYSALSIFKAWTAAGTGAIEEEEDEEEQGATVLLCEAATDSRAVTVCVKHSLLCDSGSVVRIACNQETDHYTLNASSMHITHAGVNTMMCVYCSLYYNSPTKVTSNDIHVHIPVHRMVIQHFFVWLTVAESVKTSEKETWATRSSILWVDNEGLAQGCTRGTDRELWSQCKQFQKHPCVLLQWEDEAAESWSPPAVTTQK